MSNADSNANTSLKLNKALLTQIDARRGHLSRQAFIKQILSDHLLGASSDAITDPKPE